MRAASAARKNRDSHGFYSTQRARPNTPSKPLGDWDASTSMAKPLSAYNSLKDISLASYFAKGHQRQHLINSGIITEDGRIVQLNKGFSRVVVAEQQFKMAERDEEYRGVQEYHLRKQLLSRTQASKQKMEKDNRVHKLRLQEHSVLAKRKKEREMMYDRCKLGTRHAEARKQTTMQAGKVREEKRNYAMDWKSVQSVHPENVVVTTTTNASGRRRDSATASARSHSSDSSVTYSGYSSSDVSEPRHRSKSAELTPRNNERENRKDNARNNEDEEPRRDSSEKSTPRQTRTRSPSNHSAHSDKGKGEEDTHEEMDNDDGYSSPDASPMKYEDAGDDV